MNAYRMLVVVPLLALSACISLPFGKSDNTPPPAMYTLRNSSAGLTSVATEASGRIVVVVPSPEVPPAFDTDRIAIRFEDGRIDYYADAQWSARLDELLQDVFIESAQRKFSGAVVGRPGFVPDANYRLAVKLNDFGPVYRGSPDMAPRLTAGLSLTIIELPQDTVVAQFSVSKTAVASENRLGPITSELKGVLNSAIDEALEKAAPYITEPRTIVTR